MSNSEDLTRLPRWLRRLRPVLVILGAGSLVTAIWMAWFAPARSYTLEEFTVEGGSYVVQLPWTGSKAVLLEDGVPLPRRCDLSSAGEGGFHVLAPSLPPVLRFRTGDGSNPNLNGRTYTVTVSRIEETGYRNAIGGIVLAAGLLLGIGSAGFRNLLTRPSPARLRPWVVLLCVLPAILFVIRPTAWNTVHFYPDSVGYVEGHDYRTLGYPAFIRMTGGPTDVASIPLDTVVGRDSGLVGTVRAQKIVSLAALAAFGYFLLRRLGALEVGVLLLFASQSLTGFPRSLAWDAVLTEALTTALAFVLLGLVILFDDRTDWRLGIGLGILLATAILVRPSSQLLLVLFPIIILAGGRIGGWRRRLVAMVPGFCVAAVLILGYMTWTASRIGYFGLAPFMHNNLLGNVLEVTEPEDVDAVSDPPFRTFLADCLRDAAEEGISRERHRLSYLNHWIYRIAPRHVSELISARGDPDVPYNTNLERLYGKLNTILIRKNPGRFVELVWENMKLRMRPWLLALLALFAGCLIFGGGLGTKHRGFVAATVSLYLANLVLYSAVNVPLRRYMDLWLLLLIVGLAVYTMDVVRVVWDRWRRPQSGRPIRSRDLGSQA